MAFNQSKYANEFAKEKYDRLNIQVPKGQKAIIEAHRKTKGYESLNQYVNSLIKRDMESSDNMGGAVILTELYGLQKRFRIFNRRQDGSGLTGHELSNNLKQKRPPLRAA